MSTTTILGKRSVVLGGALLALILSVVACAQLLGLSDLDKGDDLKDADLSDTPAILDASDAAADSANVAVSHCANTTQDGDETDVNCGGLSCGKCAKGQKCLVDGDCAKTCGTNKVCIGCAGIDIFDSGACIDSTEVRVRDYDAFLKKPTGGRGLEDPRCRDAGVVAPDNFSAQMAHPDLPVRRVDWCNAKAYCVSRGEKLCGALPGVDRLTTQEVGDATKDQWMAACTGLQRTEYPYDSNYNPDRCNGIDKKIGAPWDAGSGPDCKTLGLLVYDLSGNVAEWEDACDNRTGKDECLVRGGSYQSNDAGLKCKASETRPPATRTDDVGFRCCE